MGNCLSLSDSIVESPIPTPAAASPLGRLTRDAEQLQAVVVSIAAVEDEHTHTSHQHEHGVVDSSVRPDSLVWSLTPAYADHHHHSMTTIQLPNQQDHTTQTDTNQFHTINTSRVESLLPTSHTLIDLIDVHKYGHSSYGTATKHLPIYNLNSVISPPITSVSLLHSHMGLARSFKHEKEFLIEIMREKVPTKYLDWELVSVDRIYNSDWALRFLAHRASIIGKSSSGIDPRPRLNSIDTTISIDDDDHPDTSNASHQPQPNESILIELNPDRIRQIKRKQAIFAWHGTKKEALLPSIFQRGLSLDFAVRGGRRLFFSQQFSHSLSYCEPTTTSTAASSSSSSETNRHLFLCLIQLHPDEILQYDGFERIQILPIGEEERVLPIYHVQVRNRKPDRF